MNINKAEAIAKRYIGMVKQNSETVKPYFYKQAVFFGPLSRKDYSLGNIQDFCEKNKIKGGWKTVSRVFDTLFDKQL